MIKINKNIILLSFLIAASISLSTPNIQSAYADPYDSGYYHGCDDAGISDSSEKYINQDEKGPSYHTDEFMDGYYAGVNACSSSYEYSAPQSTSSNSESECDPVGGAIGGVLGQAVGDSVLPGAGGLILAPIGSAIFGGSC